MGGRSKRFEQFRGAIVVARLDPEEHAEPTFSCRDDVSSKQLYLPDTNILMRLGAKGDERRRPALTVNNVYAIQRAAEAHELVFN